MNDADRALWQRIQRAVGTRPDGVPGTATANAIASMLGISIAAINTQSATSQWPRDTEAEMHAFYGDVGSGTTQMVPPYPLFYEGAVVKKITVHQRIAGALSAALTEVLSVYGIERIKKLQLDQFDGCLNVRKKRGGTTWSVHAYGAALDFCASRNALHMDHTQALFAKPDYEAWWRAWERQGAVSLGRARDFDWMHVQFARL